MRSKSSQTLVLPAQSPSGVASWEINQSSAASSAVQEQLKLFNIRAIIDEATLGFNHLRIRGAKKVWRFFKWSKKSKILLTSVIALTMLAVQLMAIITSGAAYKRPEPYFKITLVVPNNTPNRILHAQVITRELWKIGIETELIIVDWDTLLH
ncbi:MAG: hypothetical protein ACXAEI_16400, partial [Candidatus Hodarchaeales archaeon]